MRRILVSMLLLVAVFPLIMLTPNANSQSFTTTTSQRTSSSSTTYTTLSTVTTQFTGTRTPYNESNTLRVKASGDCGTYGHYDFTTKRGEAIRGKVTSSAQIGLFIMTQSDFNAWEKAVGCDVQTALVKVPSTTSYTIDIVAPNDGIYTILLLNTSNVAAQFTITTRIEGVTATTAVATITVLRIDVNIDEFHQVKQVGLSLWDIVPIIIIAAIITVLLALLVRRRKRKVARPPTPAYTPPPTFAPPTQPAAPPAASEFCVNCGSPLPPTGRFCRKCGAPRT